MSDAVERETMRSRQLARVLSIVLNTEVVLSFRTWVDYSQARKQAENATLEHRRQKKSIIASILLKLMKRSLMRMLRQWHVSALHHRVEEANKEEGEE